MQDMFGDIFKVLLVRAVVLIMLSVDYKNKVCICVCVRARYLTRWGGQTRYLKLEGGYSLTILWFATMVID